MESETLSSYRWTISATNQNFRAIDKADAGPAALGVRVARPDVAVEGGGVVGEVGDQTSDT